MKPYLCGDDTPIYVPTTECDDCELALSRLDNLSADDVAENKTLSFTSGNTYTVTTVDETTDALVDEINEVYSDLGTISNSVAGKQDTLVSGTNIKTVNNQSLLGGGNITITGGGSSISIDDALDASSTNAVENGVIVSALAQKQDSLTFGNGLHWDDNYVTSPLADYYLARSSTNTATTAGTNKSISLTHQKSLGTAFAISGGNLVCQTAGVYEVSATATWSPDSSGSTCSVSLTMTAAGNTVSAYAVSVGGVYITPTITPSAYSFSVGDTIDLSLTATGKSGTIASGVRYTRVMVRRLS